jgi:hypothetical protein
MVTWFETCIRENYDMYFLVCKVGGSDLALSCQSCPGEPKIPVTWKSCHQTMMSAWYVLNVLQIVSKG